MVQIRTTPTAAHPSTFPTLLHLPAPYAAVMCFSKMTAQVLVKFWSSKICFEPGHVLRLAHKREPSVSIKYA